MKQTQQANVNLHIDRLVLEGFDLLAGESQQLHQIVSNNLSEMLRAQPIRPSHMESGTVPSVSDGSLRLHPGPGASSLGSAIAETIHAGLRQAVPGLLKPHQGLQG